MEKKQKNVMEFKSTRALSVNEYFEQWFRDSSYETAKEFQSGWRQRQYQYYRDDIGPVIGTIKLREITPAHVKRVLTDRRTFVRKTGIFRAYPKGGKHHSHSIPQEPLEKLRVAHAERKVEWVITSSKGKYLPYRWYMISLKRYSQELGLSKLGTHGLRHSTSELYMHHGATRDDLQKLFAHSSPTVTDLYIHNRGTNLEKVANVIRLFDHVVDQDRPRRSYPQGVLVSSD